MSSRWMILFQSTGSALCGGNMFGVSSQEVVVSLSFQVFILDVPRCLFSLHAELILGCVPYLFLCVRYWFWCCRFVVSWAMSHVCMDFNHL